MRARLHVTPLLTIAAATLLSSACSQTPVVVPLRSMERPRDVDFICLEDTGRGAWRGVSLEKCAANPDGSPANAGTFRLHALVTQLSRGELAVVDIGRFPSEPARLLKLDPRVPGYSFIPVGAVPTDVVADPQGSAVFVSSGRDPRIDVLPASILRGPIDTTASSVDRPPWPHLDFDRATEGMPTAMAIVREGATRRLFVTLPDAVPSPKIAVFDLTASAIVPARVGDIALGAPAAAALPVQTTGCGPKRTGEPWWAAYDRCIGATPRLPSGFVAPDTSTEFHLAGVTVAANRLFVADDRAPVIHVYDVGGGRGLEIRRIAVGATTARVAVSPVVPDEVTIQNSAAIDVCTARRWIGDGRDHSAESPVVAKLLGGRCRAHRYLYAIDLVNEEAGNGSIAVVDIPVTYGLDAAGAIKRDDQGTPLEERLDIDGAELVQPMACDAPSFPPRRLPLGPFGVGAANSVPARSIAFVEIDPPKDRTRVTAARCRPFDENQHPLREPDLEGIAGAERTDRIAAGVGWRVGAGPRRMRGVFGWVALANGVVTVVDIDDYDGLCRGPKTTPEDLSARPALAQFLYPGEALVALGPGATDEYYGAIVRRHHPRAFRPFEDTIRPTVSGVTFSRFNNVISNDPTNTTGRNYPHFAALGPPSGQPPRAPVVLSVPDNPYAITTENWAVTYEGQLPGFTGAFGELAEDSGKLTLRDASVGFCRRGVESDGELPSHDVIQLLDDVCKFGSCPSPAQQARCLGTFGETTAQPLAKTRSLLIEKSFEDRVVLADQHFELSGALTPGRPDLALIKECFGAGLLRYTVRASGSWVVVGSASGYLHRRIADPASTERACMTDTTRPRIQNGRTGQLPPLTLEQAGTRTPIDSNPLENSPGFCNQFVNPSWRFAIRSGFQPSTQDMRFTFGGRFSWQPLAVSAGQLTASMRAVSAYWDGRERLGWHMIASVDAVDRGLLLFPANEPFAFQKGAN